MNPIMIKDNINIKNPLFKLNLMTLVKMNIYGYILFYVLFITLSQDLKFIRCSYGK